MTEAQFALLHQDAVAPAARRVRGLVERLGWDEDDCRQQGVVLLLTLPASTLAMPTPYVITSLVRAIYRAARPSHQMQTAEDAVLSRIASTNREHALTELIDLIRSAPYNIERYLRARILDGMSWEDASAWLGWSNRRMAQVRDAAAVWLERQYDGRRGMGEGTDAVCEADAVSVR